MKAKRSVTHGLLAIAVALICASAAGQQIYGTPGSPDATMTLKGDQLPPPPPTFGGVIKETAKESTPYWPPDEG